MSPVGELLRVDGGLHTPAYRPAWVLDGASVSGRAIFASLPFSRVLCYNIDCQWQGEIDRAGFIPLSLRSLPLSSFSKGLNNDKSDEIIVKER
jgi:hypothetical protein